MNYRFKASLDTLSKWISAILMAFTLMLIVMGGLSITGIIALPDRKGSPMLPGYILSGIGTLLLIVLVAVYIYKPIYYWVDKEGIHVLRGAGIFTLERENIISVHNAQDFNIFRTIRLFGSGGLFGYTGLFYNARYGKVRMMATQLKHFVIINTRKNKTIVITPDDAEGLVSACREMKINAL